MCSRDLGIRSYTFDMSARAESLERLLSIRVLRLLIELEERGGVGLAARAIGMTQPSASRALAALEAELGYVLVRRTPLGSTLTSEGGVLAGQAREVLAEYDRLEGLAQNFSSEIPADIRLAASRTVGEHLVPSWLTQIARELPQVRVSFHVDNSQAVIAEVLGGDAPLGFVETPQLPAGIESSVLAHDRLVVIAPPDSELGATVSAPELATVGLVEREPGSGTRALLDEVLPDRARPVAQFDSNTAIVQAVAAGLGPAVLSELAVAEAVRGGKVREIEWTDCPAPRPLRAIWSGELSQAARRVLQVIEWALGEA